MNLDRLATTIEHDRRAAHEERARISPITRTDTTGDQTVPPASPTDIAADQVY